MNKQLKKLTLAAMLTALSVAFDLLFKALLPNDLFGFPYYAIPLVVGSIILGPIYGAMMGFISDVLGFALAPSGDFMILFSLSAVFWGVIPAFFYKEKNTILFLTIGITLAHLMATTSNTFALWLYFNSGAFITLPQRLILLPVNIIFITLVTREILYRTRVYTLAFSRGSK